MSTACASRVATSSAVLILLTAPGLGAQTRVGAAVGAGLVIAGGDILNGGVGVAGHGEMGLGETPLFARVEVGYRGLDDIVDPMAGEVAANSLVSLLVGLEGDASLGPLELYADLLAGTVGNPRSLKGSAAGDGTTWALAFGAGAGVRVWFGEGPVSLDLAARLLRTGDLTFARTTVAGGDLRTDMATLGLEAGLTIELR